MILIAGQAGTAGDLATLGPDTLVRALVAAVIGGMMSFPRALAAGVAIGVVRGGHPLQLPRPDRASSTSCSSSWCSSRCGSRAAGTGRGAQAVRVHPEGPAGARTAASHLVGPPPRPAGAARARHRRGRAAAHRHPAVAATCSTPPSSPSPSARCRSRCSPAGPASCRSARWPSPASAPSSPPALTGGCRSTSAGTTPVSSTRRSPASRSGSRLPSRPLCTAALAALIGVGALRVRGLLLAVTTFAFALAASSTCYRRPILSGHQTASVAFPAAVSSASTFSSAAHLLLRRAGRARGRRGRRRPAPPVRCRPVDDRRARQPGRRRRLHASRPTRAEAAGVRARRRHRRPRRRPPGGRRRRRSRSPTRFFVVDDSLRARGDRR